MLELNVSKPTRKYEAVIIMHPDASEEQQKALFQKNKEILKQFKGEFNHVDSWGKRRLANPINKLARGHYFHATFEAEAESIAELERTMNINEQVLRYNHVRLDDRVSLAKHMEAFYDHLKAMREREKEAKSKVKPKKGKAL
jgi:small subunit ribosomal protein S6